MVFDVQTAAEMIFLRIHEENASIVLTPITEKKQNFDVLCGMFSAGRIAAEKYMKEKQLEKDLED
ncbi:hypothetical protein ACYULU_15045 [Breznakiellaceae bacterium SP9]